MGCLQSRQGSSETAKEEDSAPKQYSWENKAKINPKDFMIENLKGETAGKAPGTLNGQQFIIQNCEDSNIFIFDHTACVTVDDCTNCRIFLGPIKGSVFIRDCTDCKLVIACQQFRTRDCKKLDIFMSCATQPIIEASTGMKFGCLQFYYPELEGQFRNAGLSIFNNNWSNIHDFTPVPGENNYTLLSEEVKIEDNLPPPNIEALSAVQVSYDPCKSLVPLTMGTRRRHSDECCLVVFFNDGGSHERSVSFIAEMKANHSACVLVQSKEVHMQAMDAQRVFGTDSYAMAVQQGPVIGFEYCGDGCIQFCQDTLVAVSKGTTGLVFISSNRSLAKEQIENFYNFADMQMNG